MVQHVQALDQAQELVARGVEIFGFGPGAISEIGPAIGTRVGRVCSAPAGYRSRSCRDL
jgi:hypothetical protein